MIELHKRVATYNTVNIAATVGLIIVQFLNLSLWLSWYLIFLDDDTAKLLLFWPLLLLVGIIQLNKKMMKLFIHEQNEAMYEANNVTIDRAPDSGSLDKSAWQALPSSGMAGVRTNAHSDLSFYGTLDDIGISYKIDEFTYAQTIRRGDDTVSVGSIVGDALVIDIEDAKFGDEWTLFLNDRVNFTKLVSRQEVTEQLPVGTQAGRIMFSRTTDSAVIDHIRQIVQSNDKMFDVSGQVIAMFKQDKFIYITTGDNKFKIKLPFIITKPKLDKIIVNQKAQVYRFNQFLVDISRILGL